MRRKELNYIILTKEVFKVEVKKIKIKIKLQGINLIIKEA